VAAAILERFDAETEVSLIEGSGGVLDVAVDDRGIVYSKQELGITRGEVDEIQVCDAIFAKTQ